MPEDRLPLHVRVRIETRQAALEQLGYRSYNEYLHSPHWFDLRRAYRESDLEQLCMCGSDEVQFHHTTYERLGAEELTDLVPLCANCHQMIHALERRKVIDLDFTGMENPMRAFLYRVQNIPLTERAQKEAPPSLEERAYAAAKARSKERRRRKGQAKRQPKPAPKVADEWRAPPPKPKKVPCKSRRLQVLAEAWEAEQAARKSESA